MAKISRLYLQFRQGRTEVQAQARIISRVTEIGSEIPSSLFLGLFDVSLEALGRALAASNSQTAAEIFAKGLGALLNSSNSLTGRSRSDSKQNLLDFAVVSSLPWDERS